METVSLSPSSWCEGNIGVVVITPAQIHSTKPEFRFCTGLSPVHNWQGFTVVRISDNGFGWK